MGHAKGFGFHSQCSRQPLKGLNGNSDVMRWTFFPDPSGLDLESGWEECEVSVGGSWGTCGLANAECYIPCIT